MPMYRWSSERFAEYTDGDIVVIADTVAEARKKAKKEYDKRFSAESYYEQAVRRLFLADIAKTPTQDEVLFIYGSG